MRSHKQNDRSIGARKNKKWQVSEVKHNGASNVGRQCWQTIVKTAAVYFSGEMNYAPNCSLLYPAHKCLHTLQREENIYSDKEVKVPKYETLHYDKLTENLHSNDSALYSHKSKFYIKFAFASLHHWSLYIVINSCFVVVNETYFYNS